MSDGSIAATVVRGDAWAAPALATPDAMAAATTAGASQRAAAARRRVRLRDPEVPIGGPPFYLENRVATPRCRVPAGTAAGPGSVVPAGQRPGWSEPPARQDQARHTSSASACGVRDADHSSC